MHAKEERQSHFAIWCYQTHGASTLPRKKPHLTQRLKTSADLSHRKNIRFPPGEISSDANRLIAVLFKLR